MIKTVEAIIDGDGNIRLLEPVDVKSCRRALLVILDEPGRNFGLVILRSSLPLARIHSPSPP